MEMLVDLNQETQELFRLSTRRAEMLFQSYTIDHQLALISSAQTPRQKESLYELVPDCTELVQASSAEDILQVLNLHLGTGLSSVMLSCVSAEQFEEIMDVALWKDGQLDEGALDFWLFEMMNIDSEELAEFLYQIDVTVLAEMIRSRVEIEGEFRALQIQTGLINPTSELISYEDERTRGICHAVWEADYELFIRLMGEIFDLNQSDPRSLSQRLIQIQSEREVRVEDRDQSVGITVTEEQLQQQVDLNQLDLVDVEPESE